MNQKDYEILNHLQKDGRMSNLELSQHVFLSPAQTYRRVKALEESGVIESYTAKVNTEKVGYPIMAYVSLAVVRERFHDMREFEKSITEFEQVIECQSITGDYDYLLKVVAKNLKDLSHFLTDGLMKVPGASDVRSMICLEEVKAPSPVPIDLSYETGSK